NYHDVQGKFPAGRPMNTQAALANDLNAASGFVSLLSYVEGQAQFNAWNFSTWFNDPGACTAYCFPLTNTTVASARLSYHLCPSDTSGPFVSTTGSGRNDIPRVANLAVGTYAFSAGSLGPPNTQANKDSNNGLSHYNRLNGGNGIRDITDGSANTLAVGEKI